MDKDLFIQDCFLPTLKKFFKIEDNEKDIEILLIGNYIVQEALNYTNQSDVLPQMESVIIDEGLKVYDRKNSITDEDVKSMTVGKVKIDFSKENSIKNPSIGNTDFYQKIKPFRRMRLL
ncbi:MAG: hypothetical protein ACRCZ0_12455 [Cetobacterium sp.]